MHKDMCFSKKLSSQDSTTQSQQLSEIDEGDNDGEESFCPPGLSFKEIHELTSDHWRSPAFWPKTTHYYEPSQLVRGSFEHILSAAIPGLEGKGDHGADFTYKDFFAKARAIYPETEIIIVGGLPRDIIQYAAHNEDGKRMDKKNADVDLNLTLTQDEIINVVTAILKERFPSEFTDENKKKALMKRFLTIRNNGYTGFGDKSIGENLDIFDARGLALKNRSTTDFTFNMNYYRYDEHNPVLISGAGQSLKDTVTHELRPAENWYAYSERLMEKPSTIWRYIYFLAGKEGYRDANDYGMTRFAILRALHNTIEAAEKRGRSSYEELLSWIALNDRYNPLSDERGLTNIKSINASTFKFMRKKFDTISKAMKSLRFLRKVYAEMVSDGSDIPDHFQRDILSLYNIIEVAISERMESGSFGNQEGADEMNEFKHEIDSIRATMPAATVDNKQDNLGQLYDLMFELSEVIKQASSGDYINFKESLDGLLLDQGKGFSVVDLKAVIDKYSHLIPKSLRERLGKCFWNLSKSKVAFGYENSVSLSDVALPLSLKSKLLLQGLLKTDTQRNNARKLSPGVLAAPGDGIDKCSGLFIDFMKKLAWYDRIGYQVTQVEIDKLVARLQVANSR